MEVFFQVAIGLIPIMLVLSIIFNGLRMGAIFFIAGFLIVSVVLALKMPVKEVKIKVKTDSIDKILDR